MKKYFGPSTLIAAAFIGPGTVTMCTIAGANTGYSLLWALVLAVCITIVFQEMAARLGFITGAGLGEAIRSAEIKGGSKIIFTLIVTGAILIGNAAYEAGNLSGAVLGVELLVGKLKIIPLVLGAIASIFLLAGNYKWVEKLLIALVLTMSLCFLISAIMVKPNISELLRGFVPFLSIGKVDYLLIIGIIGTTVVPYNLFLHASSISEKWNPAENSISDIRTENRVAIIIGGLVSACILITAGTTLFEQGSFTGLEGFARQLEPIFGSFAKYIMAVGFFAAGLSSAITAPLAAAYAARGLFGWEKNWKDKRFIFVWLSIIIIGVLFSSLGFKPILIIKFAQVANGILLPIIAIFLLYIVNQSSIMGEHVNSKSRNIGAIIMVVSISFIALRSLLKVFGIV